MECNVYHDRNVNTSINIRNEGLRLLNEQNIMIIHTNEDTLGTIIKVFGKNIRLIFDK
ncbi:MAG: hypothetical protein KGD57_01115 [Candidatus Lokiarchaeota archaeon]|nr:hypothetical protein [Candidatus Lokiarchaeota archaeon]